jgi:hypothetical protein
MAAPIAGVEIYRGARPNFSLRPEHLNDPSVKETCATWGQMIEAVYASSWHQHLVRDPAFQAARQERDRQRVNPRR